MRFRSQSVFSVSGSKWALPLVYAATVASSFGIAAPVAHAQVPTATVVPGWHPAGADIPPPLDVVSCTKSHRVFYSGDTVVLQLAKANGQSAILTTRYEVRDYYGTVKATGTVAAGAAATVSIAGLKPGWYKIAFLGANDRSNGDTGYTAGPWGFVTGGTTFCIFRPDTHFPTMPDTGTANTDSAMFPNDEVARGVIGMGPQRHSITTTIPFDVIHNVPAQPNRFFISGVDIMTEVEDEDPVTHVKTKRRYKVSSIDSTVGHDIALDRTWYLDHPDSARPRAELGHFANGIPGLKTGDPDYAGLKEIVRRYQNDVKYWEPSNEPQGHNTAAEGVIFAQTEFIPFRNAIHDVDATAKVLGANTVGIAPINLTWLSGFIEGGGDQSMDGFSFHAYNTVNGDLALGRASMNGLQDLLKKYSLQNIEKWQTEQSYFAAHFGTFTPRRQGQQTMMQRMLFEQYGIPKEHDVMWYDKAHGFWDYPSWYENPDFSFTPSAPLMRIYSEEVWGKTFQKALDFGPSGNNSAIGNVFSDGLVVLMSAGNTNGEVQLQNAGGATATDAWGNPVSLSSANGVTTVPVNELPVYVHGVGAGVDAVKPNWGPNLVRQPGVTISAPGTGTDKLNNGKMETWYYNQFKDPSHKDLLPSDKLDSADSPWNAGATAPTEANPIAVEVTFPSAKTVRRVVIYAAPPLQYQSTLLNYDLQWWDGTNWNKIGDTVKQDDPIQKLWTPTVRCTVDSYASDRWIFEHSFAAVTTTKLRLLVRKVTYGGSANKDDNDATADKGEERLVLREIEAYEDAPKIYSITGRVKDLTDGTVRGLAGAQVQLSGTSSATTTTDANGNYRFDNLRGGGDFSVTPSKSGQVFLPAQRSTQNLSADTALDFQNPNGEGLTGDYFKFDAPSEAQKVRESRVDPQINFNWDGKGPFDPAINNGEPDTANFGGSGGGAWQVRWGGQIQALSTESYTFHAHVDDGARLWVNGQLMFDNYSMPPNIGNPGLTDQTGTITLEEGRKYSFVMDYRQWNVVSQAKLYWSTPTRPEEIVPQRVLFPLGKGTGLRGEYFGAPDFTQLKKTRIDRVVNFNWAAGSPDALVPNDAFSVRWTGFIEPRTTESTTFTTTSDNGLRLWVNNQLIIDNWNPNVQTEKTSATVALQKGVKVPIKIEYFEDTSNASVVLKWSTPTQAKEIVPQSVLYPSSGTGVGAEYFDNADFTASKQKRIDPQINFDWKLGSPDASIDPETFSVRWKAKVEPLFSEVYTFSTLTDERVKLWVNGELLIDKTDDHTAREDVAIKTVSLVGGQKYDLKMEFADIRSFAQAKLFWASASQTKEVVPQSQLYPVTNEPPTAVLTSPTASATPYVGDSINLAATAADSDGSVQKVEFWANGSKIGEDLTAPYTLSWNGASAGDVTFVAKAIDDAGDVGESAPVTVAVGALGTGLRGEYFDEQTFVTSKLVRVDPTINFDWPNGTPDPAVAVNDFGVRWTGFIRAPKTETFNFSTIMNNGVRLWIDGQLLLNTGAQLNIEKGAAPISLVAGRKYAIKIEFVQFSGPCKAQLFWSSPSTPKAVVPMAYLYPAAAGQPTISVTAPDSLLSETPGQGGMWRLTRTGDTTASMSVNVALDGSAVNGLDFDLSPSVAGNNGTFVIPAGQASLDIPITPRDDSIYEGTEKTRLSTTPGADYATVANWVAGTGSTVDILDNDSVSSLKVNFQPASAPTVAGYELDSGAVFGLRSTTSFGWSVATTSFDRDNAASPDQRYDTLALLQGGGAMKWEALVPNGTYTVRVVAGDPNFFDGVFKVMAENVLVVNGSQSSTGSARWVEGTATVTVTDGRLTLTSGTGAQNNKLCFVEITKQ